MHESAINQTENLSDDYSLIDHMTAWFDRQGMSYTAFPEHSPLASCIIVKAAAGN